MRHIRKGRQVQAVAADTAATTVAHLYGGTCVGRIRLDGGFVPQRVQRRAGFPPVDLLVVQRVPEQDAIVAAIGVIEDGVDFAAWGERGQTFQRDGVILAHHFPTSSVGEGET